MPLSDSSCPLRIFQPLLLTFVSHSQSTSATQQEHEVTWLSAGDTPASNQHFVSLLPVWLHGNATD